MRLLNERQVAEEFGLAIATLRSWRSRGRGPRYAKLGGLVRYDLDDILQFIEACKRNPADNVKERA